MSEQDLHSPTSAGPEPDAIPVADPATEPTPVVGASEATGERPAGTAAYSAGAAPGGGLLADEEHPEKAVGAAFAGGLAAALVLKALAARRHR